MKRLYRAEATVVVYLTAEDKDEALWESPGAFRDEINDIDIDRSDVAVTEVTSETEIDVVWRGSVPRNSDTAMSCEDYVRASNLAWAEAVAGQTAADIAEHVERCDDCQANPLTCHTARGLRDRLDRARARAASLAVATGG